MNNIRSILTAVALFSLLIATSSCDNSFIFDGEGDCSPKVQFVFKKHRSALHQIPGRETDAFYSTVESVHLFVYDAETGELILDKIEKTENLVSAADLKLGMDTDRCFMSIDVNPGRYRLVAWCGLNEEDSNNAFILTDASRASYSHCEVKRAEDGHPIHSAKYEGLYHGKTVVNVKVDGSTQIIPVELTKNNNDIAIWVQHTSKTFNEGDYEVVYTDANGSMHFDDNSMASADRLEFRPHSTFLLTANTEYNGSQMESGALVAHISTSRLMEAHSGDARLEVRTREGETVFSIPFIQYVTRLQTFTNDNQYYLDCEDTYNCSFYLTGESGTWMPARIIINGWVIVPDQENEI